MYLLDTNVVFELRKIRSGKADANAGRWAASVRAIELFISVVTLQELQIGVLLTEFCDPLKGKVFRSWLASHVLPAFVGRVLSVDAAVSLRSAQLHVPDPKPFRDGLIVSTALVHSITVVTRNTQDSELTGVKLINPWLASRSNK